MKNANARSALVWSLVMPVAVVVNMVAYMFASTSPNIAVIVISGICLIASIVSPMVAITLGILGVRFASRNPGAGGRGKAVAAIVIAAISLVLVMTVLYVGLTSVQSI